MNRSIRIFSKRKIRWEKFLRDGTFFSRKTEIRLVVFDVVGIRRHVFADAFKVEPERVAERAFDNVAILVFPCAEVPADVACEHVFVRTSVYPLGRAGSSRA